MGSSDNRGRRRGGSHSSRGGGSRRNPDWRRRTSEQGGRPSPHGELDARRELIPELCELSPFSVFCTAVLGITPMDGYCPADLGKVARRFDLKREEFDTYLDEAGLSPDQLASCGFDVASARFDIKVAPEGISRMELARTLYEELLEARSL